MATIPIIQLLRNNNIYSTRADARSALEGQKNNVPDGGVILARYSGTTGEQMIIKTLAGFVSNISTHENATVTIIDVEGADKNVQDAITSAINKLNKEDTAAVGQYVSSVSEENGIIKVTRRPLPSVEKSVMVGEAVTAVTQTNGEVGVEYGSINAAYVSLTDVHGRFESDNVGGALEELHTYVNRTLGSFGAQIGALSTSSTVTLESTEGTEDGVLKVYTIKQGDKEVGKINIPKDLVVTSGSVVKGNWQGDTFTEDVSGSGTSTGTALKLVIANQEAPVYINTLDLVKDHTSGNGIAISDTNVISVKIAEGSEKFLSVDEKGVKLSGVQAAINKANTKVAKDSGADKITLSDSTAADGSVTYTIGQNDIASEAALTAHTANTVVHVTQEDKDKWNTPTDLSNYYTKSEVDEKDAAINSNIESYGHVTSQALNDLGTRMDDYGQVTSQALNDLGTKFGDYYTKTEVDSKDATLQTALDALSSSTDTKIASETTERQNADNTLQGNINNVNSGLTAHTANTTVHVTQADKDKWNTPTDLSNYYTKAEVDGKDATLQTALNALDAHVSENEDIVSQSLNDLNKRIGNTYVKSYIDALEARIAELETKFLNMENNGLQAGEY